MRCPTLTELAIPRAEHTGWPWTEGSPQMPDTMPDGSPWPRVSIVTPSYNQGQFIEETIRSVLLRRYPNPEYIIMDGASTDESVSIIRKYESWFSYVRIGPDEGQAAALTEGFNHATGHILAWLQMDLSPLENEHTFGLNRIYLLFPKLGFTTTYPVSTNRYVLEQFGKDISRLALTKFLALESAELLPATMGSILFYKFQRDLRFSTNAAFGGWDGATVTYVAMQIAYYMGFEEVILIGVDHSFSTKGPAHQLVVSSDKDPNHFSGSYFGQGVRWQLPDLDTSEMAYGLAKVAYEKSGRRILDATVGGKLAVFPKVTYTTLF